MTEYPFLTVCWMTTVTDRVWEALANYATRPTWWWGVQCIELLRRDGESGVGTILSCASAGAARCLTRSPSTSCCFRSKVGCCSTGVTLRASPGRWTLAPADVRTELRFGVDVQTARWWLIPYPVRVEENAGEFRDNYGLGARGAGVDTRCACQAALLRRRKKDGFITCPH